MLDIKSKEYETMIDEMKQGKEVVITKWGRARIKHDGYYAITSKKEGNNQMRLHRLIWEDFYGKKIPEGYDIHHLDSNKLNNAVWNLQCVEKSKHIVFHNTGQSNGMFGKYGSKHPNNKYVLWDSAKVVYDKSKRNGNKLFRCNYQGYRLPIGLFHDFVSCNIINNLINEFKEVEE